MDEKLKELLILHRNTLQRTKIWLTIDMRLGFQVSIPKWRAFLSCFVLKYDLPFWSEIKEKLLHPVLEKQV